MNPYSLKVKITAFLLVLLSIALLVLSVYLRPLLKEHLMNSAKIIQADAAKQIAANMDFSFKQAIHELEALARVPELASLRKEDLDRVITQANKVTQLFNYYFVMDREGSWLSYPTRPDLVGKSIPRENMGWVRRTFEENKTVSLDVVKARVGTLVTGFSTSIRNDAGEPVALLRGVIVLTRENPLVSPLEHTKAGENCYAYVVSARGRLIAHPKVEMSIEEFSDYDYSKFHPVQDVMHGRSGVADYEYKGQDWVTAYHPIESTGWGVVVQQPKADIEQKAAQDFRLITFTLVLTFTLVALTLSVVMHYSLRPLSNLLESIKKRKPLESESHSKDEIGQLTREFHLLYTDLARSEEELKRANDRLEERVLLRTADLEETNRRLELEINERKRTEQELENSRIRFQDVAYNTGDWIWELDSEDRYTYSSRTVEKILGCSPGEIIGKHFQYFFHPDDREENLKTAIDIFRKKEPFTGFLHRNLHRNGRAVMVETSGVPIIGTDGEFKGFRGASRDITERDAMEKQIKASLREKEILLKEIHHRVKNNLQVISSLLSLQSRYMEDPETRQLFMESQNRLRTMALIHEKLYQSRDLARVNFAEYTESLAAYLFRSYNTGAEGVRLDLNVHDVYLGADSIIPCGLIVNELVTNSLKYAFPDHRKGTIRINFTSDENGHTLSISDDGVGFPEDIDIKKTNSLGMRLVHTLVKQLEGTVELQRDNGTTFRITFKAPALIGEFDTI